MPYINQVEEQVEVISQAYEDIETLFSQPFSEETLDIKAPYGLNMPTMKACDDLFESTNHLRWYVVQMEIAWANDPIMCKSFNATLKGAVSTWFGTLQAHRHQGLGDGLPSPLYGLTTLTKDGPPPTSSLSAQGRSSRDYI